MACVGETLPDDGARKSVSGAQKGNLDPEPRPLNYTGLQLDHQGMVLPHSILGSLEDFRTYLEAKGETEWVKSIAECQRDAASEACGRPHSDAVKKDSVTPSAFRSIQRNALQHWQTHMRQRRQQQDFLSDRLDRPVEYLLMNQANHFRETQEQRELLNHVMPLVRSGYGHRVGSEFWSLPQRYGDEMSGITATLTQTEQGRQEAVTHVGQPSSIRQESGITCEALRLASRNWDQSAYLQQQYQELGEVLKEMDIKKPDISGLEVIGSCKPFTHVTVCRSPSLEKEEEETKKMKEEDPLAQYIDVHSHNLLVPALRVCGQLACWTGNKKQGLIDQGEVGISATIMFETLTGETASSHLDLHNEGSTAIFYSWQQLPVPHSFPNLRSQTKRTHFYFNCSSGVILPGGTKRVEFVFKLMEPGIKTELWQLNTHPVLLGGASMQVTLRGLALYQDTMADQRRFLETKLEKIVTVKMCRSIVYEMLQGVRSQERPGSPAELYVTEEQRFLVKNPKLQFLDDTVEDLKKLWQEVNPEHTWDLSVDSLRQAVLMSDQESAREKNLSRLNSLRLQLSEPSVHKHKQPTAAAAGLQLWRKLLDVMDDEARCLQNLLLPQSESLISEMVNKQDQSSEKKEGAAKEERSGMRSRFKDDNKGESKSASTEKLVEDSKKKGRRRDEATAKRSRGKQEKESALSTDGQIESDIQWPPEEDEQSEEMTEMYTRLLHRKVYALIEDLVDSLCDLMDELDKRHEH